MEKEKLISVPINCDKSGETIEYFKLSRLNNCYDLGRVFTDKINKIEEIDDDGTVLIAALRSKIKIGKYKFNTLETISNYSDFSLNEKKDILMAYGMDDLCTYSLSESKALEYRALRYIKDLVQINNEYLISAYYNSPHVNVEPWSNFIMKSDVYNIVFRARHDERVNCLCAVGKTHFLSGSMDKTIKYWEISASSSSKLIRTFNGHYGFVNCIELYGNDKKKFLSGSCDKTIKLWDLEKGQCLKTFYGHECGISTIQVTKNNQILSLSYDGVVKQWDITTNTCMSSFRDDTDAISFFKVLSSGNLITGLKNGRIKIWSEYKLKFKDEEEKKELKKSCSLS
ncbi:unnamed protein product [Brachionus calyciflorus]|uniref:Uncharacterized protein n=1 Tax=Brachionus calyciflorus TaxID=104777 RepID=A0A814A3D6_9BILA|nr:unnamed protein product [Brachionus calyciflorus]